VIHHRSDNDHHRSDSDTARRTKAAHFRTITETNPRWMDERRCIVGLGAHAPTWWPPERASGIWLRQSLLLLQQLPQQGTMIDPESHKHIVVMITRTLIILIGYRFFFIYIPNYSCDQNLRGLLQLHTPLSRLAGRAGLS
jgi:hypothetical protein